MVAGIFEPRRLQKARRSDDIGIAPQPQFAFGLEGKTFLPRDLGIGHSIRF